MLKHEILEIMLFMKQISIFIISAVAWLSSCFNGSKITTNLNTEPSMTIQSFYDLNSNSLTGEPISMKSFQGKKIVILNVASKCGYTPQYSDWQKFYDENKDEVVVIGFPCNQFMGQEPGGASEIAEFCQKNYGVTFPMFEKVNVKGSDKSPIYDWLSDPNKNGWCSDEPSWNFCKYLINEQGKLIAFYGSNIKPDNPDFIAGLAK